MVLEGCGSSKKLQNIMQTDSDKADANLTFTIIDKHLCSSYLGMS